MKPERRRMEVTWEVRKRYREVIEAPEELWKQPKSEIERRLLHGGPRLGNRLELIEYEGNEAGPEYRVVLEAKTPRPGAAGSPVSFMPTPPYSQGHRE